jgi:Ca-activated chloride channel family protein
MTHAPRRSRPRARLAPLLCLLSTCALVVAQSPPPARHATAQHQPPAPPVKLNVIVSDGSGGSAAEVRREEISVKEDGVPQTITQFTKEELPVSYALVIDNSGSVSPLLNYVVRTAGTIVSGNKAGDETMIVRFVDSDKIEQIQDFTDDSGDLERALASLYIDGGHTAVIDAVYVSAQRVAARRKEDAGRRRALVLISDCENRASRYSESELINLLRREGVQVFVIAFLMGLDDNTWSREHSPKWRAIKLAEKLAAETGGRAFFPKKVDELIKAVAEVSRDLRSQFVVTYASANANADGKFRKVEVKIADAPGRAKRKAVTRAGYFAPGGGPEGKKKEK